MSSACAVAARIDGGSSGRNFANTRGVRQGTLTTIWLLAEIAVLNSCTNFSGSTFGAGQQVRTTSASIPEQHDALAMAYGSQ